MILYEVSVILLKSLDLHLGAVARGVRALTLESDMQAEMGWLDHSELLYDIRKSIWILNTKPQS